ncbi:MAG TPA: 1-(5-phosphoribosyl)-5-[(5-phosphoribosylamino)methylideneamino]imidazole-4-carboxamide isomerase [Methanoregulaceae archaeon]|nr:1-(5-phosphoribosyl)-5-[(5-phosphoribosylamino)methylideneamino]imidazole-4-carboxamide isomerase [Methanoregulaceae archaeon]
MKVFPAVDILEGRCVQLVQGKRETATVFGNPIECAYRWLREGAEALHVVNLDGAFGNAKKNAGVIRDLIRETGVTIQLGGGIRSFRDAESWLDVGVERVIIGTMAIREPDIITELADRFGSAHIMPGVDARGGKITVEGWQESAGNYLEWARLFQEKGAGSLLYTNVDVEGLEQGVAFEPVRRLLMNTSIPVTVAGGISSIDDVAGLKTIGAYGVVLGSALYSGKLRLSDALEASI